MPATFSRDVLSRLAHALTDLGIAAKNPSPGFAYGEVWLTGPNVLRVHSTGEVWLYDFTQGTPNLRIPLHRWQVAFGRGWPDRLAHVVAAGLPPVKSPRR